MKHVFYVKKKKEEVCKEMRLYLQQIPESKYQKNISSLHK